LRPGSPTVRDALKDHDVPTGPAMCPFCHGSRFDTLAKVITPATCWRCRECDKTWTIENGPVSPGRSR